MKRFYFLIIIFIIFRSGVLGQRSFELIPSVGTTLTAPVDYQNCSGHFNPSVVFGFSFIYHPAPSFGLELNYSSSNPVSYLDAPGDNSVKVYTNSSIKVERLLTGLNVYIPKSKFSPYFGGLIGFTHVTTSNLIYPGTSTNFTWSLQTGVNYYFSSIIGMQFKCAMLVTPNISNNSPYYGVDEFGNGFPSFAVGDPTSSTITQWNLGLGLIVRFMRKK